jgi:hypothetical protein
MHYMGAEPEMQDDSQDMGEQAGDGLHHHTIDEDEGGGFHSTHTNPDGTQEHADHASYQEASDAMDQCFGQGGEQDDAGEEPQDDFGDGQDIAGAYSKAVK